MNVAMEFLHFVSALRAVFMVHAFFLLLVLHYGFLLITERDERLQLSMLNRCRSTVIEINIAKAFG